MKLKQILQEFANIAKRPFTDLERQYVDVFNSYIRARKAGNKDQWLKDHNDEEKHMVKTWASYVANVRSKDPDYPFEKYAKEYKQYKSPRKDYTAQEQEYADAYNEFIRARRAGKKTEFLDKLRRLDPDKLLKIKAWRNYNMNVRRNKPGTTFADFIKTYKPYKIANPPSRQLSLFDDDI